MNTKAIVVVMLMVSSCVFATDGTWTYHAWNSNTYNWSDTSKWQNGIISDGAGATATIYGEIGEYQGESHAPKINTGNRTIGHIVFDDIYHESTGKWTLTSSGLDVLTLSAPNSTPAIRTNWSGVISATIAGTHGFIKTGGYILELRGNNIYTGITDVSQGEFWVTADNGLGALGEGNHTIIRSGATLYIGAHSSEPLIISGNGVRNWGAMTIGGDTYSTGDITVSDNTKITAFSETPGTIAGNIFISSPDMLTVYTDRNNYGGGNYGYHKINITGPIIGTGGLLINGLGVVNISGDLSGFSGNITFKDGTLNITNLPVGQACPGTLFVTGGKMTVSDTLTIADNGTLQIELGGQICSGTAAAIDVNTADLGGTLNVTLLSGYSPQDNDIFDLLDWDTLTSGRFTTINLPTLSEGLRWDTSFLYTAGQIRVVSGEKYADGDGSPENPFKIASKTHLLNLAGDISDYDKCFILTDDIDMGGQIFSTAIIASDTDSSSLWFQGAAFTGTFNGNGHKITNFTITGGSNDYIGLFGSVENGLVTNLDVENCSVSGDSHVGVLAGSGGTPTYCHTSGTVNGIENAGGLAGQALYKISRCWSNGSVNGSGSGSGIGGLIGINFTNITGCYSNCSVSTVSSIRVGGLVGYNKESGVLDQCYATGSASGDYYVGGFVGYTSAGSIFFCYSTGAVSGNSSVGGLAGRNYNCTIDHCFWDVNTSGTTTSDGGSGKITTEMKMLSTFEGWDFTNESDNGNNNFWRMCSDGRDYPRLIWQFAAGDLACPEGVNMYDFSTFAEHWVAGDCNANNNYCGGADMDYSGDVYFADLAMLTENWLKPLVDVTAPGNAVKGQPNDNDWPTGETPAMAIDNNDHTKFLHFKGETQSTGIRVTPANPGTIVTGLTFTTANDYPDRDPVAFEIYGSNSGIDGPFTLIASGQIVDFNQATAWPRFTKNSTPITFANVTAYNHYQILITAVRNPAGANSMQVAEIELLSSR